MVGRPFEKGQSGNPGGRPKQDVNLREMARSYTIDALETLVSVMKSEDAPMSARVSAAESILSRGHGKPESTSNVNLNGGSIIDYLSRVVGPSGAEASPDVEEQPGSLRNGSAGGHA